MKQIKATNSPDYQSKLKLKKAKHWAKAFPNDPEKREWGSPHTPHNTSDFLMDLHEDLEQSDEEAWGSMLSKRVY